MPITEEPMRPCCGSATCPREEMARMLGGEDRPADHIRQTARILASFCSSVTEDHLKRCFTQLFNLPLECTLGDQFVAAYQSERPAPQVIAIRQTAGA